MMMCMILLNLPYLLYQESYCIETIVHLDVVLYSQSVLLSHWKQTIQCVVYCYLTCSTYIVSYSDESNVFHVLLYVISIVVYVTL